MTGKGNLYLTETYFDRNLIEICCMGKICVQKKSQIQTLIKVLLAKY